MNGNLNYYHIIIELMLPLDNIIYTDKSPTMSMLMVEAKTFHKITASNLWTEKAKRLVQIARYTFAGVLLEKDILTVPQLHRTF